MEEEEALLQDRLKQQVDRITASMPDDKQLALLKEKFAAAMRQRFMKKRNRVASDDG